MNYHAGFAAEQSVKYYYEKCGLVLGAERWRGKRGEIDLIFRDGATIVFVEVKKSKTHARAAELLRPDQMRRILNTATEFVASEPNGQNTDMRFDVALVDASGAIEIMENALMAA